MACGVASRRGGQLREPSTIDLFVRGTSAVRGRTSRDDFSPASREVHENIVRRSTGSPGTISRPEDTNVRLFHVVAAALVAAGMSSNALAQSAPVASPS